MRTASLTLVLLFSACSKLEDAGGSLTAPHQDGLRSQSALEGGQRTQAPPVAPVESMTPEEPLPPPAPTPTSALVDMSAVGASLGAAELDAVLPPPPSSDREALTVIESLPPPPLRVGGFAAPVDPMAAPEAHSAPAPPTPTILAATPCEPGGDPGVLAVSLSDLSLVQTWMEGQSFRAMVADKTGRTFVIDRGSVVGTSGAKVVRIVPGEVTLAEVQFDLAMNPVLVQQSLRPALLR